MEIECKGSKTVSPFLAIAQGKWVWDKLQQIFGAFLFLCLPYLFEGHPVDGSLAVGDAVDGVVVEDDGAPVRGERDVDLDAPGGGKAISINLPVFFSSHCRINCNR